MKVDKYKCDICGHESNSLRGFIFGFAAPGIGIMMQNVFTETLDTWICGHECALKFTNRFLSSIAPGLAPVHRSTNSTLTLTLEKEEMPKIKFSQENLLERNQLAPGWRKLKVKSIEEGPGKSDPTSIVWTCVFVVNDGSKDNGTPIRHWFSEKAMGRLVDFIRAVAGKVDAEKEYELNDAVNREVMGYCKYDIEQKFNTIEDWRPLSQQTAK